MKQVRIKDINVGGGRGFVLIAGPCVIEDEKTTLETLEGLLKITEEHGMPFVFKASYDKANRTSIDSYRGPGLEKGLKLFEKIKKDYGVCVTTDVHCTHDVQAVAEVVDCLQIPAYLSRQTDLLVAAGKSGLPVNIKKAQFMAPDAMTHAAAKVASTGNDSIIFTERGSCFGYNNLVVDFRSLPIMKQTGYPVVFDCTHSVQRPSVRGASSGGDREMIAYLTRAAVAVGIDGLFMEVHPNPEAALSDGPNSIALKDAGEFIRSLKELDDFIKARAGDVWEGDM